MDKVIRDRFTKALNRGDTTLAFALVPWSDVELLAVLDFLEEADTEQLGKRRSNQIAGLCNVGLCELVPFYDACRLGSNPASFRLTWLGRELMDHVELRHLPISCWCREFPERHSAKERDWPGFSDSSRGRSGLHLYINR